MELQLLVPGELSIMDPDDVVEAASCVDVVELWVPLKAEDPRLGALQCLLVLLSLGIIDYNPAIEESNGEDVLDDRIPGEAAARILRRHSRHVDEVHR